MGGVEGGSVGGWCLARGSYNMIGIWKFRNNPLFVATS